LESDWTEVGNQVLERPIRVVVFSGGPVLLQGVKQFICTLEDHPEIDFLACICQSEEQSFQAVIRDLWRRRGVLAIPLMAIRMVNEIWGFLTRSRARKTTASKLAIMSDRIQYVPNIHAEQVLDLVRGMAPDLGLIYGSPILKPELFEVPKLGTLGIHHGKVPGYRGKKTTFWAIYNGEKTAGVTIQRINRGLDTGDVVRSGEVLIGSRSLGSVWDELEALGIDLYIQSILEVKRGVATFQPQKGGKGKLYRDPGLADILTLWRKQIGRRIRPFSP
jgi:folate-dependent phosphoribosylglycinamide formyltransferase PurN